MFHEAERGLGRGVSRAQAGARQTVSMLHVVARGWEQDSDEGRASEAADCSTRQAGP